MFGVSRASQVQATADWPTLSGELVQGEIDGADHVCRSFLFEYHAFSVVGVYVVPSSSLQGDFTGRSATVGIVFTVVCSLALVMCIFIVVFRSFGKLRREAREHQRIFEHQAQEIILAASIAGKLANYDLGAADVVLKEQAFTSDIATPLAHLLDNLTSYSPFLPDCLFLHNDAQQDGTHPPSRPLADAMLGKHACFSTVQVCEVKRGQARELLNRRVSWVMPLRSCLLFLILHGSSCRLSAHTVTALEHGFLFFTREQTEHRKKVKS